MTSPKYKMRFNNRKCIRRGVIIEHENKFLFVFGTSHFKWSFPKGHIESGETFSQCALRELYEETGINSISLTDASIQRIDDCTYYRVKSAEQLLTKINDTTEVSDVQWLTLEEVMKLPTNSHIKRFVRIVNQVQPRQSSRQSSRQQLQPLEQTVKKLAHQLELLTRVVQELTITASTLTTSIL